jgi:hypothetical protein
MSNNNGRIAVNPQVFRDGADLLRESRESLKRWAARYAGSNHAKKQVIATAGLIQRIDDWLLKL